MKFDKNEGTLEPQIIVLQTFLAPSLPMYLQDKLGAKDENNRSKNSTKGL